MTDKPEKPSMSIETIAKGLTAAIKAISKEDDAKVALGETQKEGPHPLFYFQNWKTLRIYSQTYHFKEFV